MRMFVGVELTEILAQLYVLHYRLDITRSLNYIEI
jgi:hypothetical protein